MKCYRLMCSTQAGVECSLGWEYQYETRYAFIVLAFTTVGKCFSQETSQSGERQAEAVAMESYNQVVLRNSVRGRL